MDKVNVSYRVDERLTIRGGYNREKKKKKKKKQYIGSHGKATRDRISQSLGRCISPPYVWKALITSRIHLVLANVHYMYVYLRMYWCVVYE